MATLTLAQQQQSEALTQAFKATENRRAAKIAAAVALYYQQRVNVEDPSSIERWLNLVVSRIIGGSDDGARRAALYYNASRRIEAPGAPQFSAQASLGMVNEGVRESLLTQGPYDVVNKTVKIQKLDIPPTEAKLMIAQAKKESIKKVAASTIRHVQAGGRQTVWDNSIQDEVALGWIRVTKANPCWFCAMLASRGIQFRSFSEGSFANSDSRFTGDGNAKVHDSCGCSLKPSWAENDPIVKTSESFLDMWNEWSFGSSKEAMLNFRLGYEHFQETGISLTPEQIAARRGIAA